MIILILLVGVNFVPVLPAGVSQLPEEGKTLRLVSHNEEVISEGEEEPSVEEEEPTTPILHGPGDPEPTGGEVEVDAKGPYGTPISPYYEGDTINFTSEMINGTPADYHFLWDVDNDGRWENYWDLPPKGETNYTQTLKDDHIGLCRVGAWDGISMDVFSGNGTMFNESSRTHYFYSNGSYTLGVKFTAHQDITIYQLGAFNESYDNISNIRLWDDEGILLAQVLYPEIPENTWEWFSIPPVDLYAGSNYIVSIGINETYSPLTPNPGVSQDGMIEPIDFMYYTGSGWAFPATVLETSPLPMVDVLYDYYYEIPDTIDDVTDIYVLNVPPTVDLGNDITAKVGEEIMFIADINDPGTRDRFSIEWDFGNGDTYYKNNYVYYTYDTFGVYTVTITVTDDDGGVGTDTLIVTIQHPHLIKNLIQEMKHTIEEMNLHPGLENSLLSKLENALKSFVKGNYETAKNQLSAFMNQIRALRGRWLTHEEHEKLVSLAMPIVVYLRDY
jgi:hypothetical protein